MGFFPHQKVPVKFILAQHFSSARCRSLPSKCCALAPRLSPRIERSAQSELRHRWVGRGQRGEGRGETETRDTRHETRDTRHETVLPQSMLPCLWSSLPLELRFHDHLDVGLVGTVDLLSIHFRLWHPYPRVIFCCHLGINAISVKSGLITSALYGIRFHEFGPF